MKFDVILSNPPYNPNALWKKFVAWQIDQLTDDGKMVVVHPSMWRESSSHAGLYNTLLKGMSELHCCDYDIFKDNRIGVKTDWYVYGKGGSASLTVHYPDGSGHVFTEPPKAIHRFPPDSVPHRILQKITGGYNGCLFEKGFSPLYKRPGKLYKQCGGMGNNVGWVRDDFFRTDEPTEHQYASKVVMSYTGRPRARFFHAGEGVGVVCGIYWLTENPAYCTLLNSDMLWKLHMWLHGTKPWVKNDVPLRMRAWLLSSLRLEGLTATDARSMYDFYGLTSEERSWCGS